MKCFINDKIQTLSFDDFYSVYCKQESTKELRVLTRSEALAVYYSLLKKNVLYFPFMKTKVFELFIKSGAVCGYIHHLKVYDKNIIVTRIGMHVSNNVLVQCMLSDTSKIIDRFFKIKNLM